MCPDYSSHLSTSDRQWFVRQATDAVRDSWRRIIDDCLTRHEGSLIPEPMFVFNASMSEWGRWHGGLTRQIELHERLLFCHPWYALLDVLRHETAHQVREYLYPGSTEPPHGELFQTVCQRLGANPAASGSYPPIDEQMRPGEETTADPQTTLLNKVQKLLNLAMRGTTHEAETALAKARSLMAKHGVDESMLETKENNFVSICLGQTRKQRSRVDSAMGLLLQDFWAVKAIWIYEPAWDAELRHSYEGQNLEIHGRFDRVQVAAYVYNYLHSRIDLAWQELPAKMRDGKRRQRDFALGVLAGFRNALTKQDRQEETCALLNYGETELNEYLQIRHPRIRTVKRPACRINQKQYEAGQAVGQKIVLQPGLEQGRQKAKKTRLLK